MLVAIRSVVSVFALLGFCIFIFSMIFKQQLGGAMPDHFGSLGTAQITLLTRGTFLDNSGVFAEEIYSHSAIMLFLYLLYIMLTTYTVRELGHSPQFGVSWN